MSEAAVGGANRKWWASALLIGGILAIMCLPIGALGSKLGIWPFTGGFMLLAVGVVLATAVFFLGVIAAVLCFVRGMQAERGAVLTGVVISLVVLVFAGLQVSTATSVPSIHNITTDTLDPPAFDKLVAVREAEKANPLAYDAAKLAPLQQQAYPAVKPLISDIAPAQMLDKAVAALKAMGLEVVDVNRQGGMVEATHETFWFGFKDDVVVRVRAEGSGSIVDIRSVSRVGESDLGKNAERIVEVLNLLMNKGL